MAGVSVASPTVSPQRAVPRERRPRPPGTSEERRDASGRRRTPRNRNAANTVLAAAQQVNGANGALSSGKLDLPPGYGELCFESNMFDKHFIINRFTSDLEMTFPLHCRLHYLCTPDLKIPRN